MRVLRRTCARGRRRLRGGRWGREEVGGEFVAARLGHLHDFNREVGAAEAVDEEGGVVELELGDDVLLDGGRGGGGEGNDGRGPERWKVLA